VAVVDVDGRLVARAGDPERVAFARSSMKPLQAAVSLSLAQEELTDQEAAVMCASHNGEPIHVEAVGSLLRRAGVGFEALRCPPSRPLDASSPVLRTERRYHNCSGKHAGMLLACARRGFDFPSYREPDHPLQREVLRAVTAAAGAPRAVGVDGCGVPVHALSLVEMAGLYARLASGRVPGSLAQPAAHAVAAMTAAPYLVAGRGRVCTAVMEASSGVIVKVGAEGLVCAGIAALGLGIAAKAEDGASRAQAPMIVHALAQVGGLDDEAVGRLGLHARPVLLGGGEPVGQLEPAFQLVRT
jgi:L-asparaginase II